MFLEELQINMPDQFPGVEFTEFMARARSVLLHPKGCEWQEFGGASNLIGWRFRASVEACESYVDSDRRHGNGGGGDHDELYARERALFVMFTSGLSCLESTCYAIHALASHPRILGVSFGEKEQRRSNPRSLLDDLAEAAPAALVIKPLELMLGSGEWSTWVEFRNRMSHRSSLPRVIVMAVGGPPPKVEALRVASTTSSRPFAATIEDMRALIAWLAESLRGLLIGATALIPSESPTP